MSWREEREEMGRGKVVGQWYYIDGVRKNNMPLMGRYSIIMPVSKALCLGEEEEICLSPFPMPVAPGRLMPAWHLSLWHLSAGMPVWCGIASSWLLLWEEAGRNLLTGGEEEEEGRCSLTALFSNLLSIYL